MNEETTMEKIPFKRLQERIAIKRYGDDIATLSVTSSVPPYGDAGDNQKPTLSPYEQFAFDSARISGFGESHTGKYTKTDVIIERDRYGVEISRKVVKSLVYNDELFMRHEQLAESCLTWCAPKGRMMHPVHINMPLLGHPDFARWRDGVRAGSMDVLPRGKFVKSLINDTWLPFVEEGVNEYATKSELERDILTWALHDFFVAIEPFEKANGRTARLLMQIIRIRLDLKPAPMLPENMVFHEKRFNTFRGRVFVPMMQEHGYL